MSILKDVITGVESTIEVIKKLAHSFYHEVNLAIGGLLKISKKNYLLITVNAYKSLLLDYDMSSLLCILEVKVIFTKLIDILRILSFLCSDALPLHTNVKIMLLYLNGNFLKCKSRKISSWEVRRCLAVGWSIK